MKITLVMAPAWDNAFPSIGAPYVVAALKRAGHEVVFRDLNIQAWSALKGRLGAAWRLWEVWDPGPYEEHLAEFVDPFLQDAAEAIRGDGAEAVGFAFMGTNHHPTRKLIELVQQRSPEAKRFAGGHGISEALAHELVACGAVDAAVVGEAEQSCVELVEQWVAGRRSPVPGVVQLVEEGRAESGGPRPMSRLDDLANPDFSGFRFEDYEYSSFYDMHGAIPILGSRGCTFRCTFCSEFTSFSRYRYRRAAGVVAEMKAHSRELGSRRFVFADSLINGVHKEMVSLVDQLIDEGLEVRWGGQARIDAKLTPEVLEKMAKAGCDWMVFGFESGSQKVLDLMKKHVQVEDVYKVVRAAHAQGIRVHLNVIVGYPGETWWDFLLTLKTLARLRKSISGVSAHRLRMHASSPLFQQAEKFGIEVEEDAEELGNHRWHLSDNWRMKDGSNRRAGRMFRYRCLIRVLKALRISATWEPLQVDP